jgi:hypothetical protein
MGMNTVRPRANTLGHLDLVHFDPHHLPINLANGMHMNAFQTSMDFDFGGMPHQLPHNGNFHGLPKLNTQLHPGDMSNSLRTAPPTTNFGGFEADHLFNPHHTINPAALHAGDVVPVPSNMPFGFDPNLAQHMPPGDDFSWMRDWNMQHMAGGHENDPEVFEESSPSRISSGDSPADFNDSLNNSHANLPIDFQWPPAEGPAQPLLSPGGFDTLGSGFSHLGVMGETVSPSHLHQSANGDAYFQQHMMQAAGQTHLHPNMQPQQQHMQHMQHQHLQQQAHVDNMQSQSTSVFGHPLSQFDSNSPSMSAASLNGSGIGARKSSMTTHSADSITESTRQALLNTLSQPSVYGGHMYRKYSQPSVSSPLSGGGRPSAQSTGPNLPSTADIRRYIDAFIQYAHPHLPVVHYASLSFDSIENTVGRATSPSGNMGKDHNVGGAKCLILSMAAIGALYEYDHPASKELFDAAKKMIALYLEEKRKNEMSSRHGRSGAQAAPEALPPLWLVQAILLNVIYGHHCGDKLAAEVASQHISSLIGLMRAAKVTESMSADFDISADMTGSGEDGHPLARHPTQDAYLHAQWINWKTKEERKRCFLAMYFVSSLLLIGYNQTPAIMNSEIHLCLPCEEDLYNAESAQEWHNRGGLAAAQQQEIPFTDALNHLLSAGQRSANGQHTDGELKPSTYGCLILICALHNVIWETRNRQADTDCTAQQMEDMVSNIAPALKAWQAAWKANDHHRIERPNPFGLGPLAADCIPLLDLAFVRLYVDLGPTQEAFRERDFDRMANELASRTEALHFQNDSKSDDGNDAKYNQSSSNQNPQSPADNASARREKHLRRAAFYAADSLTVACQYNLTYADQAAHELPIQSAVGFLACVQVLSEWVSAVQERVGPQLGMLGRDAIDFSQMPAVALLEAEDLELLHKMDDICQRLEQKRLAQENLLAVEMNNFNPSSTGINPGRNKVDLSGYGSAGKLTRVIAMMLEKAVIWPITHVIAQALEVEAQYLDRRAAASLTAN